MEFSDDVEKWIWIQDSIGAGSPKSLRIIKYFGGASQVYSADETALRESGILTKREIQSLLDKSLCTARKTVSTCMRLGCKVLTPEDEGRYPRKLFDLPNPPCVLYVLGEIPDDEKNLFISVVGTRKMTPYGCEAATRLSEGIARRGAVVVSGFAMGVDTAAHKGALKAQGKTVAVMGCGVDVDYPKGHDELKRIISHNGAVISEYPPGTRVDRISFPIRNRIIAAISSGTLVVEAANRSGALITASISLELGRDVFAVPGNIFSSMSEGPNRLIADGAKPVLGAEDILDEYRTLEPLPQPIPTASDEGPAPDERASAEKPSGLDVAEEAVYSVFKDEKPVHSDMIAMMANLPSGRVLAALTRLQIEGLVKPLPGSMYVKI